MKKILIVLLLCTFVAPIFADDALVLPKGVMRIYLVPNYTFANSYFDDQGEADDTVKGYEKIQVITLGAAVEFGLLDWISVAAQWTPTWSVWSDFEADEYAYLKGPFDLFAGAKVQIIGPKAPVPNDTMRFCLAPGVKIPIKPDDDSLTELAKAFPFPSDDYLVTTTDKHVLGIGGRAYFDYLLSEEFYVNLYGEFIYYPTAADTADGGANEGALKALLLVDEIGYGYDLTLEAEPHYDTWINDSMQLKIGLPVTYTMSPEQEWDGSAAADTDSNLLEIGPNVAIFTTILPMPIEVELGYTLPLMGKNNFANNKIVMQIKGFLKF